MITMINILEEGIVDGAKGVGQKVMNFGRAVAPAVPNMLMTAGSIGSLIGFGGGLVPNLSPAAAETLGTLAKGGMTASMAGVGMSLAPRLKGIKNQVSQNLQNMNSPQQQSQQMSPEQIQAHLNYLQNQMKQQQPPASSQPVVNSNKPRVA